MGLRERFMLKQKYGTGNLTLTAKAGQSLLVRDIFAYNPATSYLTLSIDKATVGYFRIGGNLGNQLPLPMGNVNHSHGLTVAAADGALTEDHALSNAYGIANATLAVFSNLSALTTVADKLLNTAIPKGGYQTLLSYLAARELFGGFPIGEGQTLTLTGAAQALALQSVLYEEYDAADNKPTDPNGSDSKEYLYVNYGRTAAAVTTSVSTIIDTAVTPAEFPDFPFGKVVPSKLEVELLGILASDAVDDRSGTDDMATSYLKLIRDRVTLFDDDKNGIFCKGIIGTTDAATQFGRGLSFLGNFSDVDQKPPLMFDPPLKFTAGDELGVYWTTVAGAGVSSASLAAADLEVGLIQRVRRL